MERPVKPKFGKARVVDYFDSIAQQLEDEERKKLRKRRSSQAKTGSSQPTNNTHSSASSAGHLHKTAELLQSANVALSNLTGSESNQAPKERSVSAWHATSQVAGSKTNLNLRHYPLLPQVVLETLQQQAKPHRSELHAPNLASHPQISEPILNNSNNNNNVVVKRSFIPLQHSANTRRHLQRSSKQANFKSNQSPASDVNKLKQTKSQYKTTKNLLERNSSSSCTAPTTPRSAAAKTDNTTTELNHTTLQQKKQKPNRLKKIILRERSERNHHQINTDDGVSRIRTRSQSAPPLLLCVRRKVHNEEEDAAGTSAVETQLATINRLLSFSLPARLDKCSLVFDAFAAAAHNSSNLKSLLQTQQIAAGHSNKWRPYCDHVQSPALNKIIRSMLTKLNHYQSRKWKQDVRKAKLRRRYICGLNEVRQHIRLRYEKHVLVVMAPDAEVSQNRAGLYERIRLIQMRAQAKKVPIVYALNKFAIGQTMRKNGPVMAVLVFGGGMEDIITDELNQVRAMLPALQHEYQQRLAKALRMRPSPAAVVDDAVCGVQALTETLLNTSLEQLNDDANGDDDDDEN